MDMQGRRNITDHANSVDKLLGSTIRTTYVDPLLAIIDAQAIEIQTLISERDGVVFKIKRNNSRVHDATEKFNQALTALRGMEE